MHHWDKLRPRVHLDMSCIPSDSLNGIINAWLILLELIRDICGMFSNVVMRIIAFRSSNTEQCLKSKN